MSEEELPTEDQTIKELEERIKQLEKEKEEYLSGWKRAKSEMLKFQKETEEKMKNFMLVANANLISDLLPILDSFDLALNSLTDEDKKKPLGRGYYLIQTQILNILSRYGLTVVEAEGKKFDPNFHEIIDTKKCDKKDCNKEDEGLIIEVLSKGYMLHNQLIRPAKVRVITH